MRKNIYYIGEMLLLCLGFVVISGWSCLGQSQVTDEQGREFVKGNRDTCFLRKYVAVLKTGKATDELSVVVDAYLMALPFGQRYPVGNVSDFMDYVKGMEAASLLDIVVNWDKISVPEDQKKLLVDKIAQNCSVAMFDWVTNREKSPDLKRPDAGKLEQALVGSTIPLPGSKKILIGMWEASGKGDVPRLVEEVKQMFAAPCTLVSIFDLYVFGDMLNYLLENVNLPQCKMMLVILEDALEKHGKDPLMSVLKGMKDNFEGKTMMLEMDEE